VGRYREDRQLDIWNFFGNGIGPDSLDAFPFRIENAKFSRETAIDKVLEDASTQMIDIVGASNDENAFRIEQGLGEHTACDL